MGEPFKNIFDAGAVAQIGGMLSAHLDVDDFVSEVSPQLAALELKARVDLIARALRRHLPADYVDAVAIILDALPAPLEGTDVASGFVMWPFCHFVELYGEDEFDVSMDALYELTRRFSGEFAIRPLIASHPEAALERLHRWAEDDDVHVRRLVSEGTRTRLPWASRLQCFIDDPMPVISLLEKLKDDPEEYVRRSVANNLNDLAKDHPELVVSVADEWWMEDDKNRQRLIRRALRTLIKAGHAGALNVIGYSEPRVKNVQLRISEERVAVGDSFEMAVEIASSSGEDQRLLIDYIVHFQKARGTLSPKVFKWTEKTLRAGERLVVSKTHTMKKVSTRRYHPGLHRVQVSINGVVFGDAPFVLEASDETP